MFLPETYAQVLMKWYLYDLGMNSILINKLKHKLFKNLLVTLLSKLVYGCTLWLGLEFYKLVFHQLIDLILPSLLSNYKIDGEVNYNFFLNKQYIDTLLPILCIAKVDW